jgi:H+/Cl- antiporter ClcA
MILMVSATAVMFAEATAELLSRFLPIHTTLFPKMQLVTLGIRDIWIPFAVGIVIGLLAVLFLKYYRIIKKQVIRILKRISKAYLIFAVFAITLIFGFFSSAFVSTGYDLMLSLFEGGKAIYALLLILIVRATLTLFANSSGITGGLFVPILALGAISSALIGRVLILLGLGQEYWVIIIALGITACISAMMKMPLTAIVFAVEALSCYENILYVIVVAVVSYVITEFFGVQSITDKVIEHRMEGMHKSDCAHVAETYVTVKDGSFAVGKQIRDIFWPNNLFVLSVKFATRDHVEVDEHGGKAIRANDVLHVRYSTYDPQKTLDELLAIVGEQDVTVIEVDQV